MPPASRLSAFPPSPTGKLRWTWNADIILSFPYLLLLRNSPPLPPPSTTTYPSLQFLLPLLSLVTLFLLASSLPLLLFSVELFPDEMRSSPLHLVYLTPPGA